MPDLTCNATKTCTACGDNYVLSNSLCLECTTTDTNCIGCSATNLRACTKCKYGYYLNGASRRCVKCSNKCTGCLSEEACLSCSDGFYLAKS